MVETPRVKILRTLKSNPKRLVFKPQNIDVVPCLVLNEVFTVEMTLANNLIQSSQWETKIQLASFVDD